MLKTQFSSKVDLSGFGTELFNCKDVNLISGQLPPKYFLGLRLGLGLGFGLR